MKPTSLIQFTAKQLSESSPEDTASLREACATLSACDLLTSYEGTDVIGSNGNVSERRVTGFIITATKLPSKQNLSAQDCVHIETCDGGEARFHGGVTGCGHHRLEDPNSLPAWGEDIN